MVLGGGAIVSIISSLLFFFCSRPTAQIWETMTMWGWITNKALLNTELTRRRKMVSPL